MLIRVEWRAIRQSTLGEHLTRFALGGLATVVASLIAKEAGPVIGGLFLAFPAIFPASATLVEKHAREKKAQAGICRTIRGRLSAAIDARGTAIGGLALLTFAVAAWNLIGRWNAALALSMCFLIWLAVALAAWRLRRFLKHAVR